MKKVVLLIVLSCLFIGCKNHVSSNQNNAYLKVVNNCEGTCIDSLKLVYCDDANAPYYTNEQWNIKEFTISVNLNYGDCSFIDGVFDVFEGYYLHAITTAQKTIPFDNNIYFAYLEPKNPIEVFYYQASDGKYKYYGNEKVVTLISLGRLVGSVE